MNRKCTCDNDLIVTVGSTQFLKLGNELNNISHIRTIEVIDNCINFGFQRIRKYNRLYGSTDYEVQYFDYCKKTDNNDEYTKLKKILKID